MQMAGLELRNQLVAEVGDALLEFVERLCVPFGAVRAGDSVLAGEGNEQDVVIVVGCVAVDTLLAKAGCGERDGCLADNGLPIVAIGVTPDTVELGVC